MITSIMKRDGRVVLYDAGKIASAILKALEAAGEGDAAEAARVANRVERELRWNAVPTPPGSSRSRTWWSGSSWNAATTRRPKRYILYRANRTPHPGSQFPADEDHRRDHHVDARLSDMSATTPTSTATPPWAACCRSATAGAKSYNAAYLLTPEAGQGPPGGRYPHPRFRFLFPDHHLLPDRYSAAVPRRVLHRARFPAGTQEHRQLCGAGGDRDPVQPERPARRPEHPEL